LRCEVVAIGTELLLGQITDTNSSWIGERLALIGIDSHFQVKVGDNFDRIAFCLRQALDRADAVICCGGLGPTQDDITRDVIAAVMGVPLHRDAVIEQKILDLFSARGRVMTDNNRRQADIPEGGSTIAEMPGTAPGLICPIGDKVMYAVPGVPFEMHEMMEGTILPDLQRRAGTAAVIRSRVLRTWGQSESGLAEILAPRIEELDAIGNPTLAFLASGMEGLKVRITAKAPDEDQAAEIIAAEELLIRGLLEDVIFGVDDQTMESIVLDQLRAEGRSLAVFEALTGGLVATRLSALDPAHQIFLGSRVGAWKSPSGAPTPPGLERAAAAASQVRDALGADVGLSALGPAPGEEAPPGAVHMGIAMDGAATARTVALPGKRARVREYAVINLLNTLRRTLAGEA
jgi:nicotinamide-nucleotide amidase